jgi:hypothetical protein
MECQESYERLSARSGCHAIAVLHKSGHTYKLYIDILSFDILSFDILLFDILSFDILSFDILLFNISDLEQKSWQPQISEEMPRSECGSSRQPVSATSFRTFLLRNEFVKSAFQRHGRRTFFNCLVI